MKDNMERLAYDLIRTMDTCANSLHWSGGMEASAAVRCSEKLSRAVKEAHDRIAAIAREEWEPDGSTLAEKPQSKEIPNGLHE